MFRVRRLVTLGHSKCHEKNIVVVLFEAKRGFNKITSWSRAVPSPELEVLVDRVKFGVEVDAHHY